MKITKNIWLAILVVAMGVGGFFIISGGDESTNENTTTQQAQFPSVGLVVDEENKTASYTGVVGETALETLQSLTVVQTQSTSFGDQVTGIENMLSEDGINFWAFYVNGEFANEGAGTFMPEDGDQIEWRLENIEL